MEEEEEEEEEEERCVALRCVALRCERCVAADTSRQNLNLYHKYGVNLAEKTSRPKVNIPCIKRKLKNLNLRAGSAVRPTNVVC
jgi:hypothetical protein